MYLKKELYELIKTDESILDLIMDSALDGLWYWDLEKPENQWMNAKFWTVLGYDPNEMQHNVSAWQNILNQDDLKHAIGNLTEHLENPNHQYEQILRYTHKNGSTVRIRCRGILVHDKNGEPFRMLGTHEEIPDIKNVKHELIRLKEKAEESEAKILKVTENISEVIWLADAANKKIIYVNPAYEEVWGHSCQSLYDNYKSFLDSVYKEDQQAVLALFDNYEKGEEINSEYRIVDSKGEIKWVRIRIVSLKNAKGEVVRHLGTAVDISETKNFQHTLTLLVNMAKSFINIPLNNISKEIDKALQTMGKFVNADRAYIFEYDWENQICINTYEWCNKGITPAIENLQELPISEIKWWVDAHTKGEKIIISDVSSLSEDNNIRKILDPQGVKSLFTLPLMQSGKCIGFIGFDSVREYHHYTQREEVILTFYSEIMVNIQNRQVQENSLILEKEKAQESDKLKTAFIRNISHEIKTPLNGILGITQILTEIDIPMDERTKLFKALSISSERLMNTITDYMDMSMIFSETVKVNRKEFVLKPLIKEITQKAKELVSEKDIKFETIISSKYDKLKITTDPELLKNILYKLIDNAIKFTGEGSVIFTYDVKYGYITFFVQDSGKGIATDKLNIIFKMFAQEDSSSTRRHDGSGLGLKIAKELTILLDGEINVATELGEGSVFTIAIPIK